MEVTLAPFTLTLVCRQPLVRPYEPCQHAHGDDCCGAPRIDGKLPEGHEHSTYDCCTHDCGDDGSCGSDDSYSPALKGAHKQCGVTATFTGETLTAVTDQAVAAGWRVDVAWLGFYSRSDVCAGCSAEGGRRPDLSLVAGTLTSDAYAAA